MAKAMLFNGKTAYTVEIKIRFMKKAVAGEKYRVFARLLTSRRNLHKLEAFLRENNEVIAKAEATFFSI